MKSDLFEITFIIPIRIDSEERLNNIDYVIWYLQSNFNANIILTENDKVSRLHGRYKNIDYIFWQNNENTFHRTKMLNEMTKKATTKYIAVYDADVVLPIESYIMGYDSLKGATDVFYPFNNKFIGISNKEVGTIIDFNNINGNVISENSVGGCFFIKKDKYIEAGLENENFVAWGYEDNERYERFSKLNYCISVYMKHPLYHLYHPPTKEANFNNPAIASQFQEYNKIKEMAKDNLKSYINSWSWKI